MKDLDTHGEDRQTCPEHGHALVNVHKIRENQRIVIGQICPEPRCQHSEMTPRALERSMPLERTAI